MGIEIKKVWKKTSRVLGTAMRSARSTAVEDMAEVNMATMTDQVGMPKPRGTADTEVEGIVEKSSEMIAATNTAIIALWVYCAMEWREGELTSRLYCRFR